MREHVISLQEIDEQVLKAKSLKPIEELKSVFENNYDAIVVVDEDMESKTVMIVKDYQGIEGLKKLFAYFYPSFSQNA
jgi:peptidoglycan hydrolase-like protein with peptidoglycan-binding domain